MNRAQKIIVTVGVLSLVMLLSFPPWQQAAKQEVDYRYDLGRGFILSPPRPVAVDCYFAECQTAPPSYFHVLLHRQLLIEQCCTIVFIVLVATWMFRMRPDNSHATLQSSKTRFISSMLLALAVPLTGGFPLASMLLDIPRQIMRRNELWLMPVLFLPAVFALCTGFIYLLLTLGAWLSTGRLSRATVNPSHR